MPSHHDVRFENVDMKRLGSVLALAHDTPPENFDSLLLLNGLGPRNTPIAHSDFRSDFMEHPRGFQIRPVFSFALGGKDGHPLSSSPQSL